MTPVHLFGTKTGKAEVSGTPGAEVLRNQLGRLEKPFPWAKPSTLSPKSFSHLLPQPRALASLEGLELEASQGAGMLAWVGVGEAAMERMAAPFPEKGSVTGCP